MNTKPKTSSPGTPKAAKPPAGNHCVGGVCSMPSRPQSGPKISGNSGKR